MKKSKISLALVIGGLITATFIIAGLLSLVWTPAVPTRMNIAQKLKAPLDYGLLGTDHFGRDLLSLLMVGAWNSLSIALMAVAIGAIIGVVVGITVAALRGWTERLVMRLCDIIFSLPPLLSAMMLGAVIGSGRYTAIIAIAVFMVPVFARMTLAAAKQLWARDFVLAAVALGRGKLAVSLVHVLPNLSGLIVVQVAIQLGMAILTEAGLSFLGLGMAPPAPTWGRMLAESQTYLTTAPWMALFPGLAIVCFVSGLNLLGDGLRDYLDPKSRS